MSRWRRTRPQPRCPDCLRPATSPTTSIGRRSPPPASAAWRLWRPNVSWPCAPASARRRNEFEMARSRDGFTDMDWDKLKVFHAAAEAGSFTHAGEQLGLSQSAVSRQVSALEQELSVSLFHRHAPGLILTARGGLLFRPAQDVFRQLQAARAKLPDSRERPSGDLKITTPPALGINWLIPRLGEFTSLYPDIRISLIVTDEDLDLSMREADVAI